MSEFQVRKDAIGTTRLVDTVEPDIGDSDGAIVVRIDRFAFTSNNITYGVAGDRLGYWQFFPPALPADTNSHDDDNSWGVLPVWGYADVIASKSPALIAGERLFGYFPPSSFLVMQPAGVKHTSLVDAAAHRAVLPAGYNRYRRVSNEPGYDRSMDELQALLFPLYITSFCLWDALKDNNWYGAEQIIILSASSKTSIGLGYALAQDEDAPPATGFTSARHISTLNELNLYKDCLSYDEVSMLSNVPSVIVDMSGNRDILGQLHTLLADNMKQTLNVGITHWDKPRPAAGIISDRSDMFFAPSHIQQRYKDWGPAQFEQRSSTFLQAALADTKSWLAMQQINGLNELSSVYADVCNGSMPVNRGLIITM